MHLVLYAVEFNLSAEIKRLRLLSETGDTGRRHRVATDRYIVAQKSSGLDLIWARP